MFRLICSLPFLALVGCAGSVQLEDVDPFGAAWSAIWIHYDDSDFDAIVVTNVFDACTKYENWAAVQKDFLDEIEDMDPDDYCADAKDLAIEAAEASKALSHEGVHTLSLGVFDGDSSEPDEETYEVGDSDASLGGSLTYENDTPADAIINDWDEDEDYEDGCGVDSDDLEGDSDTWFLAEGSQLEISGLNDGKSLTATLEGELEDEDGDGEGEIAATFTATYCEVDL